MGIRRRTTEFVYEFADATGVQSIQERNVEESMEYSLYMDWGSNP